MAAEDTFTLTLTRATLHYVLEASDNAAARARAFRKPHIVAHREAAELAAQRADAANRELFAQAGLVADEGRKHDLRCLTCGTLAGCPVLQTEVHDA
jgi:hypothetical protein